MIQIDNLTPLQVVLAEQLWNMASQDAVDEWIMGLPDDFRHDAYLVLELMTLAYEDTAAEQDLSQAQYVIRYIQSL